MDDLHPHLAPDPADPEPRPTRPWTILGRLAEAIRQQNWFAVALELAIVVLGVVIGFQVTSWGQARSDRVKEQVYLRQLAADLRESEQLIAQADARMRPADRATKRMIRAFYLLEPPPRDSLIRWISDAYSYTTVQPVLGTAEALVATGDLGLIQDDSLRSAITTYLQTCRRLISSQEKLAADWQANINLPMQDIDPYELGTMYFPATLDSLSTYDPDFPIPPEPRQIRFPLDVDAHLSNRSYNRAWSDAYAKKTNLRSARARMRASGESLRALVEAQIGR